LAHLEVAQAAADTIAAFAALPLRCTAVGAVFGSAACIERLAAVGELYDPPGPGASARCARRLLETDDSDAGAAAHTPPALTRPAHHRPQAARLCGP